MICPDIMQRGLQDKGQKLHKAYKLTCRPGEEYTQDAQGSLVDAHCSSLFTTLPFTLKSDLIHMLNSAGILLIGNVIGIWFYSQSK